MGWSEYKTSKKPYPLAEGHKYLWSSVDTFYMDGRIRLPGCRRTSRDLRSQQTAPTLDNIVRTVAACQILLFFVEKSFLFDSLAIPLNESPLDIICLIILITSCSFYSFKFTDFIVVSKMDLALVSNSFSCVFIMNS